MPPTQGVHGDYPAGRLPRWSRQSRRIRLIDDACEHFRPIAADAIRWTRTQLTEEERLWLKDLKFVRFVESLPLFGCHARYASKMGLRDG